MKKLQLLTLAIAISITVSFAQWQLTGNNGTNPNVNFVGTKDTNALVFRVNNQRAGLLDFLAKKGNTSFGFLSLGAAPSGATNTALGYKAIFKNTKGYSNVAVGAFALNNNTVGHNLVAIGDSALFNQILGTAVIDIDGGDTIDFLYQNTAIGSKALFANTKGYYNTATGYQALFSNTTGFGNTAVGFNSIRSNITGHDNTAIGHFSLNSNTGNQNTAAGSFSLFSNLSGTANTASGYFSLEANTTGSFNTAIGLNALNANTIQAKNTAIGYAAGNTHTSSASTFVGFGAITSVDGVDNSMALGFSASVSASNQVRVGSPAVQSIGGFVDWTDLPSDGRFKQNVKENVPGLNFIKLLRPITYTINVTAINKKLHIPADNTTQKSIDTKAKEVHTGFIAQEVEVAAKKLSYDFNGVDAPKNADDIYGIRYAKFVVPLVKAVQELSKTNDTLQQQLNAQQKEIEELKTMLLSSNQSSSSSLQTGIKLPGVSLGQNVPNPFNGTTTISYSLPTRFTSAQIIITDERGKQLKQFNLSRSGTLSIDASAFSSGTYYYILYIDGKQYETKQMLVIK